MKTILVVFAFALLSLSAFAQSAQEPTPPSYCKPCLFYGGDFDPNGPSPNSMLNQDTVTDSSTMYVPFAVPPNQTWTVTGLFSNDLLTVPALAPPEIEWAISQGIGEGVSGTVIASGTAKATLTPTGRSWDGMNEYTVLGRLNAGQLIMLTPGHYWMTAVPMRTYNSPPKFQCEGAQFRISDVEDVPAPHAKGFESTDESYWYAPWAGDVFSETGGPDGICSMQGGGGGCDRFSTGLLGTTTPDN
jgi:hypothetical protein